VECAERKRNTMHYVLETIAWGVGIVSSLVCIVILLSAPRLYRHRYRLRPSGKKLWLLYILRVESEFGAFACLGFLPVIGDGWPESLLLWTMSALVCVMVFTLAIRPRFERRVR